MKKEQLAALLETHHAQFIHQLRGLHAADFCYAPEGKWSAAQQLDHLVRSVTPVNMALCLPRFILRWKFGTANRDSKTFEVLVEKYQRKLQEGGRASGRFVPAPVGAEHKEQLLAQLHAVVGRLCNRTLKETELSLDKYILPHPLLGKLTLREMLYFTAYHAAHHSKLVAKGLETRTIHTV